MVATMSLSEYRMAVAGQCVSGQALDACPLIF
jgi:hypothetical protein